MVDRDVVHEVEHEEVGSILPDEPDADDGHGGGKWSTRSGYAWGALCA